MKDIWYADNKDLVKWAILFRLANKFKAERILQIAYYRQSDFKRITVNGQGLDIPREVISHFRNIHGIENIDSKVKVTVFNKIIQNRDTYLKEIIAVLSKHQHQKCVVFLDPDTGLQPLKVKPGLQHVLSKNVGKIWNKMKVGDTLVFYQHKTSMNNKPWVEPKKIQMAEAIGVPKGAIKLAHGFAIARDVVFFYIQKPLVSY